MHKARRGILVGALAASAALVGLTEAGAAPLSGTWGGTRAVLKLDEKGGRIEFGCGFATLASPVTPDRKGRFKTVGAFFPDPVGLVDADLPAVQTPARISGTFTGDTLRLAFRPANGQTETFDLVAGTPHKLIRCL